MACKIVFPSSIQETYSFLSGKVLNNRKIIFLAAQKCPLALHVRNTNLCLNYGGPLFTCAIRSASIERRLSQKVNCW